MRDTIRPTTLILSLVAAFSANSIARGQSTPAPATPKYNVLFIISDDLKNEPGAWGGRAITPNIDKLAKEGVRFDNAYCQFALCNPSRSSMLTGRYPGSTGVLGNGTNFQTVNPQIVSLPRYFKNNGYASIRSGKIFHEGIDDAEGWTEGGEATRGGRAGAASGGAPAGRGARGGTADESASADLLDDPLYFVAVPGPTSTGEALPPLKTLSANPNTGVVPGTTNDTSLTQGQRSDRWLIMPGNGEQDGDYQKTTRAIELLQKYKDRPFFMGFGLSKPHSPPGAPRKFYDLYSLDKIQLPVDFQPRPTVPEGFPQGSIRPRNADLFIGRDASEIEAKEVIRAYLASTSYMDSNVGRVMTELDKLGLREKTIVVFWGDHGYQLGEKGKWSKAGSVWEEGSRTPLIISVPGNAANGKASTRTVEAVDFYSTLAELAGLPAPTNQQGDSLVPLVKDPAAPWDHPAYTVWSEDGRTYTAAALRTEKWRYAEFTLGGPMLIDMEKDPHQIKNLANDPAYAPVVADLGKQMKEFKAKYSPQ